MRYEYETEPMVSIIIPTKDYADVTEQCLKSLFEKTTYKNYEVILMNNNSERKKLLIYLKNIKTNTQILES